MFRDAEETAPPPLTAGERSPSPSPLKAGTGRIWHDYLVPQDWAHFTAEEHGVWDTLFARQVPYLGDHIIRPFIDGIDRLGLDQPGLPDLARLNARLEPLTGWRCVPVAGLVPDRAFFAMLADRAFPVGNFIRSADSLDYLEEPDCFHDIFGHVPLLAYPPMARLMESMGRLGFESATPDESEIVSRLYWHSVEFGLARENGEVKLLGAGLASSFGEAHFALEAGVPRPRFTVREAAATGYRSDAFQPLYFVADSLEAVAAELDLLDGPTLRSLAP